jgi:L-lactate dehydrogenase complex protein LldE
MPITEGKIMKTRNDPDRSDTVYFFGTCLMDAVYPDAGMAAIRLLEALGVKVVFPQDQSCCGQPAYNSGFVHEARSVARSRFGV